MSVSLRPNSPHAVSGERLLRSDRLRRRPEFLRVQRDGTRVRTEHFTIMVLTPAAGPDPSPDRLFPSPEMPARLGVTVTKRVANAVGRNRVRRIVREVFRRNREFFPTDCVLVWVARTGAEKLDYAAVRSELLASRAALQHATAPKRSRTSSTEAHR